MKRLSFYLFSIASLLTALCFLLLTACSGGSDEPEQEPEKPEQPGQPETPAKPNVPQGEVRWMEQHPRLLWTAAEQKETERLLQSDASMMQLADYLRTQAAHICTLADIPYGVDGSGTMLNTASKYLYRLTTLSLAYRLYGTRTYLLTVERILKTICSYPNWHPSHYLDTAQLTAAVAIAYDWLYDDLSEEVRGKVREAIYRQALTVAITEYDTGMSDSWAKRESNWNALCNTCMVLGALAVAEWYPDEARAVLDGAAQYLPNCINGLAPDGVCYEGMNYWMYTGAYLAYYLKAVGDNDPHPTPVRSIAGIDRTALWFWRCILPNTYKFDYADSSVCPINSPAFFYYSRTYGLPEVAEWYRNQVKKSVTQGTSLNELFFLSLAWYDTPPHTDAKPLPALQVYRNDVSDMVVFNGNHDTPHWLYVVAKGGTPMKTHQQMDAGTFLVVSDGVCWTYEPAAENYGVPGFWEYEQEGRRWNYVRNSNLSHNTVSIDRQLHRAAGHAGLSGWEAEAGAPWARLDMGEMLAPLATRAQRTFCLTDDCTLEVTDEADIADPSMSLCWQAGTPAQVTVSGPTAYLQFADKEFWMQIMEPAGATFRTFPLTVATSAEKPLEGVTMMEVAARWPDGKGKIRVRMSSQPLPR